MIRGCISTVNYLSVEVVETTGMKIKDGRPLHEPLSSKTFKNRYFETDYLKRIFELPNHTSRKLVSIYSLLLGIWTEARLPFLKAPPPPFYQNKASHEMILTTQ